MTPTDATATGTQTAPTDEVGVEVGADEREEMEEEEEEEGTQGVEEEGGRRSRGTQVEKGAEGTIRAAERAGGKATWWRGVALGKGTGEGGWEGKGVAWKKARRERKRKAKAAEGANARRAKRRRLAREEKAAETRTDDRGDAGVTTTPTAREGTIPNNGQSLPSSNVGVTPGTPAIQPTPIPPSSGVRPRKIWLKTSSKKNFVLRREEGIDLTFIHRHDDADIPLPPSLETSPNPSTSRSERKEKAADRGRGGASFVKDFIIFVDSNGKRATPNSIKQFVPEREKADLRIEVVVVYTLEEASSKVRRGEIKVGEKVVMVDCLTNNVRKVKGRPQATPREVADKMDNLIDLLISRRAAAVVACEVKPQRYSNVRPFNETLHHLYLAKEARDCPTQVELQHLDRDGFHVKRECSDVIDKTYAYGIRESKVVADHHDERRVEDLRDRIPKARHVAPLQPPAHDDDRREAAGKLARLEKLDREVEEEAKRVEEEKKEEKRRIQKEMERQRDILIRIDDDESRDSSTHSRRDSSWKGSREERRPPGYSPGTTLTPTPAPLPSTRPSRQETLKRQEVRPKERRGEPTRRRDASNDRRRRR